MFVLDTNTLVYYFKGMGRVAASLLSHAPNEVAVSVITAYELEVGIAKSAAPVKRRKQFDGFLSVVQVLPFLEKEARAAARIRAALESAGPPIGPLDNLIAGTAKAHDATLVTHNVREFRRVHGLHVVDWY